MELDDTGQLCATFTNSKLTRVATRKGRNFGMDNKYMYALLFHIDPFTLPNLGTFDLWVSASRNNRISIQLIVAHIAASITSIHGHCAFESRAGCLG
jgi:hypothetical protein